MEKHTAHCKLPLIRSLIEAGRVKATAGAMVYLKLSVVDDVRVVSFKEL